MRDPFPFSTFLSCCTFMSHNCIFMHLLWKFKSAILFSELFHSSIFNHWTYDLQLCWCKLVWMATVWMVILPILLRHWVMVEFSSKFLYSKLIRQFTIWDCCEYLDWMQYCCMAMSSIKFLCMPYWHRKLINKVNDK